MAIIKGLSVLMYVPDGLITITAFYDYTNGIPTRIDTLNTTGKPYQVRLRLADGSRQIAVTIQAGANSITIPAQLASKIDMRPYGDEPGELAGINPTEWVLECWI